MQRERTVMEDLGRERHRENLNRQIEESTCEETKTMIKDRERIE